MSLPVRIDAFKYSFFPRTITDWNSLPLAVRLSQSIQFSLSMARHLPIIADHNDTPAVTGGLHPLLKNRRVSCCRAEYSWRRRPQWQK